MYLININTHSQQLKPILIQHKWIDKKKKKKNPIVLRGNLIGCELLYKTDITNSNPPTLFLVWTCKKKKKNSYNFFGTQKTPLQKS
jgi:hypothetical protein